MAHAWFKIFDSFRLGGRAPEDDAIDLRDRRSMEIGFITEIRIEAD